MSSVTFLTFLDLVPTAVFVLSVAVLAVSVFSMSSVTFLDLVPTAVISDALFANLAFIFALTGWRLSSNLSSASVGQPSLQYMSPYSIKGVSHNAHSV